MINEFCIINITQNKWAQHVDIGKLSDNEINNLLIVTNKLYSVE